MINYLALFDTQKEKELFQAVYERYSQQLCRLALHILGSNIQAEDMVHETFLIFARNMDKIDMPDSPRTWNYLATILRRLCFNAYKKQSKVSSHDMTSGNVPELSDESIEDDMLDREKSELLKESILQMDYPYRQVTLLQYYNEMSSREIAETLGLSPDNVRQIARRAREQLKKKLTETGYFQ